MVQAARVALSAIVAILLAGPARGVHAQATSSDAPVARPRFASTPAVDSMIAHAFNLTALGDTNAALDVLEHANDRAPKDANVLYWRGMLLSRTAERGFSDAKQQWLAWRLLSRGADIDPKNARYLVEMGRSRLRTPMLRIEAERLFRKALKVAESSGDVSQLADVCFELGQIKERRYNTVNHRYQISRQGLAFDPDGHLQQKHYTKEFLSQSSYPIENSGAIDRAEAEELYRRGLTAVAVHEGNALGLLRVLYDQKRYPEMRRVVQPFLDGGTGSAHVRMAAGLAAYRINQLPEARRLFDDALVRMTDADRRDATGLSRILKRREAQAYEALSAESRQNTDSAYWESADPLLSTPENEGRLEFLSRVALADLRFTDEDMRTTGWRTDRGLILIRYGEPPVIANFPPIFDTGVGDAMGRITTLWYYPNEERQFVFNGPAAMNYAIFAGSMRGIAEEQREDAPFLLDGLPIAAGVDTIPVQTAAFRDGSGTGTRLVVASLFNTNKLYASAEVDRATLALSLRTGAPSRLRLTRAETLSVQLPAGALTTRVWHERFAPGVVRIRVEAQDAGVRGATARAQMEFDFKPAVAGRLELSDILFADRVSAPPASIRGLDGLAISPRGSLTLRQRDTVSVYWENYGVTPDAAGRVRLDVRLDVKLLEIDRRDQNAVQRMLGDVVDFVGLTREGESQVGVSFSTEESLAGRDRVPQITTIGLGSSPAGRYSLEITVTDRNSGRTTRMARIFHLANR